MATFTQSIMEEKAEIEVDIVDLQHADDVLIRFTSNNYSLNTTIFMTRQQAEQLILKLSEALD